MKRIEDEYNAPHLSNIIVNGTLSIVANEPHKKLRFTNSQYFPKKRQARSLQRIPSRSGEGMESPGNISVASVVRALEAKRTMRKLHTKQTFKQS